MQLLKIALFSTLSLNAFANTPGADIANPEVSSSPKIFSQISPTTHKVFLGVQLAYAAFHLWDWQKTNAEELQKHLKKKAKNRFAGDFEADPLPYTDLIETAGKYIPWHLFAMHVEQKIHSKSQPSKENRYIHFLKFAIITLSHSYNLRQSCPSAFQALFNSKKSLTGLQLIADVTGCLYYVSHAALQYTTIRALEDPKHKTVPPALKLTLNITSFVAISFLLYEGMTLLKSDPMLSIKYLLCLAYYLTQTLFANQLVTAAERHIAAQQSQA